MVLKYVKLSFFWNCSFGRIFRYRDTCPTIQYAYRKKRYRDTIRFHLIVLPLRNTSSQTNRDRQWHQKPASTIGTVSSQLWLEPLSQQTVLVVKMNTPQHDSWGTKHKQYYLNNHVISKEKCIVHIDKMTICDHSVILCILGFHLCFSSKPVLWITKSQRSYFSNKTNVFQESEPCRSIYI